jgi:hypothetical protein
MFPSPSFGPPLLSASPSPPPPWGIPPPLDGVVVVGAGVVGAGVVGWGAGVELAGGAGVGVGAGVEIVAGAWPAAAALADAIGFATLWWTRCFTRLCLGLGFDAVAEVVVVGVALATALCVELVDAEPQPATTSATNSAAAGKRMCLMVTFLCLSVWSLDDKDCGEHGLLPGGFILAPCTALS